MPRPLSYDYDIEKIETLLNEGLSLRKIAAELGYNHSVFCRWMNRNVMVEKVFRLTYIKKKLKIPKLKPGPK